jgi:hypothetical protein
LATFLCVAPRPSSAIGRRGDATQEVRMYLSRTISNPWMRRYRSLAFSIPLLTLTLGACARPSSSPPGEEPIRVPISQVTRDKVDILFMVDNSISMEAMAQELRNRFGQFFTVFNNLAATGTYADLHIGVVTSDYGAGQGTGICNDFGGGQQGLLQLLGSDASAGCQPVQGSVNYITYNFAPGGANNLPSGQDLVQTFTCMASVGTRGCGYEHPLESVRAALLNPANGDFVRPDALLAVVFLTNEDDCSAPPDSDLFRAGTEAQYGYPSSYRCTRFGLTCNGQLPSSQGTSNPIMCNPGGLATGGELYDVVRYIDFFTLPRAMGGIKDRPADDVLLVGIDPVSEGIGGSGGVSPIEVLLSDPATPLGQPYVPCNAFDPDASPACVPVVQHACQNSTNPEFFGDPAVRLNAVINAVPLHNITSICADDYTPALQGISQRVATQLATGCLTSALAAPSNPDCTVEDVTESEGQAPQVVPLARCDANETPPCWKLEAKVACQRYSPASLALTVVRGSSPLPSTTTRISCVTAR